MSKSNVLSYLRIAHCSSVHKNVNQANHERFFLNELSVAIVICD